VTPRLAGGVREHLDDRSRLEFDYRLVRVWELPVEAVLAGGLGTLPLAPVTAVAEGDLPAVVERMRVRLDREASPRSARELWLSTRILLGLHHDRAFAAALLKGVLDMRESTTFQEIVEIGEARGEARGRVAGERDALVRAGTRKFGPPSPAVAARLSAIDDPGQFWVS